MPGSLNTAPLRFISKQDKSVNDTIYQQTFNTDVSKTLNVCPDPLTNLPLYGMPEIALNSTINNEIYSGIPTNATQVQVYPHSLLVEASATTANQTIPDIHNMAKPVPVLKYNITDNTEVEREIAVFNNFVENGEWLYNLTRSIAEAEEDQSVPVSTLSDSLNKMLKIENDPLLPVQFNNKQMPNAINGNNCERLKNLELQETFNENKEYIVYMNYLGSSQCCGYAKILETNEDLFALSSDYALVHCVSEDLWISNDVAMHFRSKFERVEEVYLQKQKPGGLAILNVNGQFVYFLVTKRLSGNETTLQNLFTSLNMMHKHIKQNKINKLALPRINKSDFDGLQWIKVQPMLEYLFRQKPYVIKVCDFIPNYIFFLQLTKSNIFNVNYPLVDIEEGTIIIYFGYQDGFITEEIKNLNTKFRIIIDYKMATRNVGDIIPAYKENRTYLLCGFIVQRTKDDCFQLANFKKCVCALAKLNGKRQNKYQYIAIKNFQTDDELIMNKVANILRYSFKSKLDIYICWPGDSIKGIELPIDKHYQCF